MLYILTFELHMIQHANNIRGPHMYYLPIDLKIHMKMRAGTAIKKSVPQQCNDSAFDIGEMAWFIRPRRAKQRLLPQVLKR